MSTISPVVEAYADRLQEVQFAFPHARIGGSIGRSALYAQLLGNPFYEFDARGEEALGTPVQPRDIDVYGLREYDDVHAGRVEDLVDTGAYGAIFGKIIYADGTYVLMADRHKFEEELHPAVMEPVHTRAVYDLPVTTVSPETQLALYSYKGKPREKDAETVALLKEAVGDKSLSKELYGPFMKLNQLNLDDRFMGLRGIYWNLVPESARMRMSRFIKPVKSLLLDRTKQN